MPVLMKFSKSTGLRDFASLVRNPGNLRLKPIVFTGPSIGFDPTVCISDSKYFSLILNDTEGFPKYKPLYTLYEALLGMGLSNSEGEIHRKQRKIITPLFHFGTLQAANLVLERNATVFLEEDLPKQGYILTQGSFRSYTLDVIIDYAFSGSFDKQWMRAEWHIILRSFPLLNLLRIFVGDFVRYLPNPCTHHVSLVRRRIRAFLAQRRALLASRSITHDAVLRAAGSETDGAPPAAAPSPHAGAQISIDLGMNLADQLLLAGCQEDRIIDECATFLFAGEDTTSSLLAWTAYELSRAPAEQVRHHDSDGPGLGRFSGDSEIACTRDERTVFRVQQLE